MKVTLAAGIESASGKCGDMMFRTRTRPDGKKETYAYFLPKKGWDDRKKKITYGYTRKSKPTPKEIAARDRFAKASDAYKAMTDEQLKQYQIEWKAARFILNGKKYNTLRGYIIARLYADQVV